MDNSTHQSPTPLQAAVIGRKPCQEWSKGFFVPGMVGGGGVWRMGGGEGKGCLGVFEGRLVIFNGGWVFIINNTTTTTKNTTTNIIHNMKHNNKNKNNNIYINKTTTRKKLITNITTITT